MMSRQQLKNTISSYKSSVSQESKNDLESELEKAQKYNSMLFQASGAIIEDLDSSILSDKSYDSLLLDISKVHLYQLEETIHIAY